MNTKELNNKSPEREYIKLDIPETDGAIKHVEEIKEAVGEGVIETTLPDKMSDLQIMLDNLSEEMGSWRKWHKTDYLGAIETLKSQVQEVQDEWKNLSDGMRAQRERLESLLQSFPGVIETATVKALSLRVAHLEQLVSQLFQESQTRAALRGARRQYIISLVALGITIVLWGVFIGLNILK